MKKLALLWVLAIITTLSTAQAMDFFKKLDFMEGLRLYYSTIKPKTAAERATDAYAKPEIKRTATPKIKSPNPSTAKAAPKAPVLSPTQILSTANPIINRIILRQPNGWECGFYSVFHYLATKRELGYKRRTPIRASSYQTFLKNLFKLDGGMQQLHDNNEYLSSLQITHMIQLMGGDLNEVLVIEEQQISGSIPIEVDIIDKINTLRRRNTPFWVIVCTKHPAHWVCLIVTPANEEYPYGQCIGIDSYAPNKAPNDQRILVTIKNLCLGIVPLPSSEQFLTTYRNYRGLMDIPRDSDVFIESRNVILADALNNGFIQETLESLVGYLEQRHRIDHKPQRRRKKVIIIED